MYGKLRGTMTMTVVLSSLVLLCIFVMGSVRIAHAVRFEDAGNDKTNYKYISQSYVNKLRTNKTLKGQIYCPRQ